MTTTLASSHFNNLSKTLVCSLYHLCYVEDHQAYQQYIQQYDNSQQLGQLLHILADRIDAHIVKHSYLDYQPQGASINMLLAEKPTQHSVDAHLDKSHIHLHTYPDNKQKNGVYAFRIDIDIATCGTISPLRALKPLLALFPVSVMRLDYHIRGFTRNQQQHKQYQDKNFVWIADYLSTTQRQNYRIRQQQIIDLRANYAHFINKVPQQMVFLNQKTAASNNYQQLIQMEMLTLYQKL